MKTIRTIAAIALLLITGCGPTHPNARGGIQIGTTATGCAITQFEWQGHAYITVHYGGTVHAGHCSCKTK